MREENKPKIMLWLCAAQFLISIIVVGLNAPARTFVRLHIGEDTFVAGHYTQERKVRDSHFTLHLWSIELACASGVVGILMFVILLITICFTGWSRLQRKIRNPQALKVDNENPLSRPAEVRNAASKMVFLHPRVIISGCLLVCLFFSMAACLSVFIANGTSDNFDPAKVLRGDARIGSFNIEHYICQLLLLWTREEQGPTSSVMLIQERCMLTKYARWATLLSAVFAIFQFFFCIWVLDVISQPVKSRSEVQRVRDWLDNRNKNKDRDSSEKQPTVARVAGRLTCWRDTVCDGPSEAAFPGPWDDNIYAPSSRTVQPKAILSLANASEISSYPGPATLTGNGSAFVFDFGLEVGGIVHLSYTASGSGVLGLAFSEAKNWIGLASDSSNGLFKSGDLAIYDAPFAGTGNHSYTMPDEKLRGGFRYLTLFLLTNSTDASIDIGDVDLEIAFQPTWSNLRAYNGYFHSSDELLNRIWYAGAYTLQTNAVPVNTGRAWPALSAGWANNGSLANGSTVIVDGAKRDRAVWPGDMGVAVPAAFVSTGELESVRAALEVMFDYQEADGAIPEAGPPLLQKGSDTYHMWTMIGTYNYVLYSGDLDFLALVWERYLKAMDYVYAKVDDSGLLNVTGTRDWARWQQGWNNTEANMILYHTLTTAATLSDWATNTTNSTLSTTFQSRASSLRTAINTHTWDATASLYRDNATLTALHPQDANALSLYFSVATPNTTALISAGLTQNWTPIGAEAPELPGNISPFISSLELHGHCAAGRADRALALARRAWGWYANHPNGTGSTVIEGYLTNGSFGYRSSRGYAFDASYVSHAHGWSAGPTSVLTDKQALAKTA
ncbi:putative alpha-l-rhamnosidase protein [Neofusicoccum parvum]|nr:putative alpha-l-rhamnosidase protein [Neofusicoccum parvum]